MRRWVLVFALVGLVLLRNVPASANHAAAPTAPRLVVFEVLASPT